MTIGRMLMAEYFLVNTNPASSNKIAATIETELLLFELDCADPVGTSVWPDAYAGFRFKPLSCFANTPLAANKTATIVKPRIDNKNL